MATLDNRILQERLILKESTVGSGGCSVGKLAQKVRELKKVANVDKNRVTFQSVRDSCVRDLVQYQLEINKCSKMVDLCGSEILNYEREEEKIENEITVAQKTISELQDRLLVQQKVREYTEACEKKAALVNELPSVNSLKRQIEESENANSMLLNTIVVIDKQIGKRCKQYDALVEAIEALTQPLPIDDSYGAVTIEEEYEEDEMQNGTEESRNKRGNDDEDLNDSVNNIQEEEDDS